MVRRLAVSLACVATAFPALVEGQVVGPRAQLQPPPPAAPGPDTLQPRRDTPQPPPTAAPGPDVLQRRRGPRVRVPAPPPTDAAPVAPRRPMISAFVVPPGLSEPIEYLLADLGFESGKTFPLTPLTSFDVAYECYAHGLYSDAIIFASHGLEMCDDARLHLLKGVCLLHRGMGPAAELTATDFRNAVAAQRTFGLDQAEERINDPMAVRFADVVQYQATGR
jgi:hypothetical protein